MPTPYLTRNNQDLQYYDFLLGKYNSVDLTMLFLVGYSAAFEHSHTSDCIWIPSTVIHAEGDELITDNTFFSKAHQYLEGKGSIELDPNGLLFNTHALKYLLSDLGLTRDKRSVIPRFMRSSEFGPINLDALVYFTKTERLKDESLEEYTYRVEAQRQDWEANRFNVFYQARYQVALGLLYGLANSGYGTLPLTRKDTLWFQSDVIPANLIRDALNVVQNTLYNENTNRQGSNLFNVSLDRAVRASEETLDRVHPSLLYGEIEPA